MSDMVQKPDVDQIVSSVRRLVGSERVGEALVGGASQQSRPPPAQAQPEDALILAPKFRIDDPEVLRLRPDQAIPTEEPARGDEVTREAPAAAVAAHAQSRQGTALHQLISQITALETAVADSAGQWEPDGAGRDPYAGTPSRAMIWEAEDGPVAPTGQKDRNASAGSEGNLPDEALLRALVRQMVRSELQGDAGSALTRMIREIVRQELRRAGPEG